MPPASEPGAEIFTLAFGAVLLANGLGVLVLSVLLRSRRHPEVPAFGAGLFIYGLRVLADLESFRSATPVPAIVWDHTWPICLYFQPVVSFVFVEHYWGAGMYSGFRRIWQFHLAFAVVAAGVDVATGTPAAALAGHLLLVIVWMLFLLLHIVIGRLHASPEDRVFLASTLLLVATIVHDALVDLEAFRWNVSLQPLGALIWVGCLGYALVRRTMSNELRLAKLDAELQVARQVKRIQQSLLPRAFLRLPEGACAVRHIPTEAVGGDLYDFLPVDHQRFGVMVAGVGGHGVPATLVASMVKTGAASQVHLADRPAEVLAGMNRYLYGQLDESYVTAIYAYVDMAARRVSLANAGHLPPLLLSRDNRKAREVGVRGPWLGLLPGEEYATTELSLYPGDRLVLYSSGVVEAASPDGKLFSPLRLRRLLLDEGSFSAEEWADRVLARLTAWIGRGDLRLDDDLTLVVLDIPD